jgi:hypothetical protein
MSHDVPSFAVDLCVLSAGRETIRMPILNTPISVLPAPSAPALSA